MRSTNPPSRMFFTKGKGVGDMELAAFEAALRDAGIEKFNLVRVSSIIPERCKIVKKEEGVKLLSAGRITFVVLSRIASNEPNRLIAASVGMAIPIAAREYGYLSEFKSFGESEEVAGKKAEEVAAQMLASTLGVELSTNQQNRKEMKAAFRMKNQTVKTANITQSAIVGKDGRWTCAVAAAVFI